MAGSVAAVGVVAGLASFVVGLALVGGAATAGQRLAGAADAAALAAADAASGASTGDPCARAREVAAAAGASVTTCEVDALVATISVEGGYVGLVVRASARAAPPPSL